LGLIRLSLILARSRSGVKRTHHSLKSPACSCVSITLPASS